MNFPFGLMEHLPNIHPMVVHFPLALLPVALIFAVVNFLLRHAWLDRTAAALYVLGGVGGCLAYFTGKRAEESLPYIPPQALRTLAEHADWALWSLYLLIPVVLLRPVLSWLDRRSKRLSRLSVRGVLLLVALLGTGFLVVAADRGGEAVFRHGVGVAAVHDTEPAPAPEAVDQAGPAEERLRRGGDGSLRWVPLAGDGEALGTILRPAPGSPSDSVRWRDQEERWEEQGLSLSVSGPALLFLPDEFEDVQVEVHLDLSGFEGKVGVVHHGRNFQNFEAFLLYPDGRAVLERREQGGIRSLDQGRVTVRPGRIHLTVSAAGRHFYGRIDSEMIAHGHASPWGPGSCGLFLDGRGIIRLISITVTPV